MRRRTTLRTTLALTIALSAMLIAAGPAGAWYEAVNSGQTESYEIFEPAVGCRFVNNPGQMDDELDSLFIKKIKNVHGLASPPNNSKVGVRVQIFRNTPPHSDGIFQKYDVLPWVYKMANNNTNPKDFGPWTYHVPNNTTSQWRVRILINWYNQAGTLVGRVRGLPEVYTHRPPDASAEYTIGTDTGTGSNVGYCRKEFH